MKTTLWVCAFVAMFASSPPRPEAGAQSAAAVWTAVRARSGLDTPLRSLVLKGRVVDGHNLLTGEFGMGRGPIEYRFLAPAHFLEVKTYESDRGPLFAFRRGFRGGVAFGGLDKSRSGPGVTAGTSANESFGTLQISAVRLALVVGLATDLSGPVNVVGVNGTRSVEFTGPDGSRMALDLDADQRPARLRFREEREFPAATDSRQTPRSPASAAPAGRRRTVDVSWLLEDHRTVNGISAPFRIRDTADGVLFRILQFDEVLINPPLKAEEFRPS